VTLVARIGALSDIGLHRKTNEDSFVTAAPLFAVCDGMGGALAGEVASALAAETLAAGVAAGRPLLESAEAANAAVFAKAESESGHQGMGTTLTAVLLEVETGHFVHIGDSRGYLLRAGELQQMTDDHSLVGEMMRDGRLTEEEAAVHPHRSVLSRALGTEARVHIDEFEVDLEVGDVLLLCSDGLSGAVPADDIRKALGRDDPQDAARRLIAEARKHGGPDNITAVVLRLEEAAEGDAGDAAGEATTAVIDADAEQTAILPAVEATTAVLPVPGTEDAAGGEEPQADGRDAGGPVAGATSAEPHVPFAADAAVAAGAAPEPEAAQDGKRRTRRRLGLVVVILSLVLLVGAAGAFTTSTVFFVGVDGGRLIVYSGVPVKVGDHRLNPVYRKSTRSYTMLSPQQKALVDAQTIHDRDGVMALAAVLGMWP
jgi:protein phosphatase